MKGILNKLFLKLNFSSITQRRMANSEKYKATNILLVIAFPIFLVSLAEIIQMKTVKKFILFTTEKPSVVLFSIALITIIFIALLLLFKKAYIATTALGLFVITLSVIELFKFNTSGNHLILSELLLAVNVKSMTKFAYIKITPQLVACVTLLFAYFFAVYWFNPVVKIRRLRRFLTSGICFAMVAVIVGTPAIAIPVYSFFDIDTSSADNVFRLNNKFDHNNFIAFLAETTTNSVSKRIEEPENYDIKAISEKIDDYNETDINSKFKKPNVIMIMSEAFTDFRAFDELEIPESTYKSFDNIRKDGFSGKAVVPAFGSFTVKTEFELMFGLPVKSLNDPNMPQRLLLDREQQTIPSYYKSLGYNTNYIHTFVSSFYGRDEIFANYGYDNMFFDDSLTVEPTYYKSYISDTTIFNQSMKIIEETEEPTFIYTTTMQNHQPYDTIAEGETELDVYLEGIEDMTKNLEVFIKQLEELDEPTVVFFIGDHFPCFKGENSVYNSLGTTADNCSDLYVQEYFIWSNYDLNYSNAPKETISSFYLPYVVLELIGAPKSGLVDAMLDKIGTLPIYTTNYDYTIPNDSDLDMFTYDIVLGEQYLGGKESATS